MRAALFRSAARRLAFEPENGLEVIVYADVTVYEARGDLQLVVRELEPRGAGALQLAFEQLRRRLEAEGLFDAARKRALPRLPACLGVVASPTSAALRDVLQIAARRFPAARILISPTRVQGEGAELEIAAALDALAAQAGIDVVLLVRGGGSLEDLRAFNSEAVARAIVRSRAPVVTGVGHEVDVTIADLAADLRAPTPSAAAELALPDRAALVDAARARLPARAPGARRGYGRGGGAARARARRAARARAHGAAARAPRTARRGRRAPSRAPRARASSGPARARRAGRPPRIALAARRPRAGLRDRASRERRRDRARASATSSRAIASRCASPRPSSKRPCRACARCGEPEAARGATGRCARFVDAPECRR